MESVEVQEPPEDRQASPGDVQRDTGSHRRRTEVSPHQEAGEKEEGEDDEGSVVEGEGDKEETKKDDAEEEEDNLLLTKLEALRYRRVQAQRRVSKSRRALEKSNTYYKGGDNEQGRESETKPAGLASAIVGQKRERTDDTATGESREERPSEQLNDPTIKKRNKKMFGVLMGHLASAKSSLNTAKEKQIQKKREQRWKEVEEKEQEHSAKLKEDYEKQHREELQQAEHERDRLLSNEVELDAKLLTSKLQKHHNSVYFGEWIRTRAQPQLFWAPNRYASYSHSFFVWVYLEHVCGNAAPIRTSGNEAYQERTRKQNLISQE
eukprot:gb/GECG01006263.1/.p1 GENE.gb/GECG01006263.1/~~gb/GECG01006263.1/.p1  ORF type:complete len:322 (+),score=72.41 gb/GECG01006263.1/:1-966(+)